MTSKHATPAEITAARLAAGHTQKQAAELLGYTERGWRHWENGTRAMRNVLLSQYKTMTGSEIHK